jgi:hypothetical protein
MRMRMRMRTMGHTIIAQFVALMNYLGLSAE